MIHFETYSSMKQPLNFRDVLLCCWIIRRFQSLSLKYPPRSVKVCLSFTDEGSVMLCMKFPVENLKDPILIPALLLHLDDWIVRYIGIWDIGFTIYLPLLII